MAGIGFELKRLFNKKGITASIKAYAYATMVCTGPMLLGFFLIAGVIVLSELAGAQRHDRELLVSMLTYALLASLTVTSLFSMLTTRFMADMIYEKKYTLLMPSFYGSNAMMLVIGGTLYSLFLMFCGVDLVYKILSFLYFMTLIVVWTEMNYLTAIKDYRNLMLTFLFGLIIAYVCATLFVFVFHIPIVLAMFMAICIAYGFMMIWYFLLLYRYFPEGLGTSVEFLRWFDTNPQLSLIGFFITLGLFGHLVIMWTSDLKVLVEGLFYGAPTYDVAAIMAFFSILITTVNFVTSVETRFYITYRNYFALFNDGGSISNIEEAEQNMMRVLREELGYLAQKQLFVTISYIILGTILLPQLPLGFNNEMLKIFRVLCIGYSFYAIGNSIMLISLYFADLSGALIDATLFAVISNATTIVISLFFKNYYGFGFVLGAMVFCISAWVRLCLYLSKLKYNFLSKQSIFLEVNEGFFTRYVEKCRIHAEKVQRNRRIEYGKKHPDKERDWIEDE